MEPNFRNLLIKKYITDQILLQKRRSNTFLKNYIREDLGIKSIQSGTSVTSKKYFLVRGWSETEAEKFVREIFSAKENISCFCIENWIKKGYTEEQAIYEIKCRRKLNIDMILLY